MKRLLDILPQEDQPTVLCHLLRSLTKPGVTVPSSFVEDSIACMERCHHFGRAHVLAMLAKARGTLRDVGSESLMPVSRMPFGLIEYAASFFSSKSMYQVCVAATHVSSLRCVLYPMHRLSALMTTSCGARPCTTSLAQNGAKSILDQCGVWRLFHKMDHIHWDFPGDQWTYVALSAICKTPIYVCCQTGKD